jgi:hypothetical protein
MPEREIKAPPSCDNCPFHQRLESFFEVCKLYPNKAKPFPREANTKYDFCKIEKIIVYERD